MGLRSSNTALIALCLVGLLSHALAGAASLRGSGGDRALDADRPPSLAETDSLAAPTNANSAPAPAKPSAATTTAAKPPAPTDKTAANKTRKRDAHRPLGPGRDPTRAPNANGQASGSEVMDEDFVKRESNPESFRPWNGKVKIPSAADEAFEKELALMTKGNSVGKQQEEQNSVQLRQQRVANDNIKYLRTISTVAQQRIARLSELAKAMEAARVQAFEKNKEVVQNAAQYSTEDQRQRLERLKKESDEKLQREKDALFRKAEISALDEDENRDELEAKMNNLLPVDYKFTPQSEKVASNGGTDITAVPDKSKASAAAVQAAKASKVTSNLSASANNATAGATASSVSSSTTSAAKVSAASAPTTKAATTAATASQPTATTPKPAATSSTPSATPAQATPAPTASATTASGTAPAKL